MGVQPRPLIYNRPHRGKEAAAASCSGIKRLSVSPMRIGVNIHVAWGLGWPTGRDQGFKMFCKDCGKRIGEIDAKFCSGCGAPLTETSATIRPAAACLSVRPRPLSFAEFRKRKEGERQNNFQPKKKNGKYSTFSQKEQSVTITIGLLTFKNGELKARRGRSMPVEVPSNATSDLILERAVEKHRRHDRQLMSGEYTLLYPDGTEVLMMPGKEGDKFVLSKYKEDIGKPYSRILLNICTKREYLLKEIPKCIQEPESDDDEDYEKMLDEDKEFDKLLEIPTFVPSSTTTLMGSTMTMDQQPGPSQGSAQSRTAGKEVDSNTVTCPMCWDRFPISRIVQHSQGCSDLWVGEVHSPPQDDVQEIDPVAVKEETDIKSVIAELEGNLSGDEKRINLRRRYIWKDYKDARRKFSVTAADKLKVVFIGEPAIDDGGPKREFFTGKINFLGLMGYFLLK